MVGKREVAELIDEEFAAGGGADLELAAGEVRADAGDADQALVGRVLDAEDPQRRQAALGTSTEESNWQARTASRPVGANTRILCSRSSLSGKAGLPAGLPRV